MCSTTGLESTEESKSAHTRASGKRTLYRGVEVAREGAPQNVSFEYSVSNWREKNYRPKMNFAKQGVHAKGTVVYSEEGRKFIRMRETNIKLLIYGGGTRGVQK